VSRTTVHATMLALLFAAAKHAADGGPHRTLGPKVSTRAAHVDARPFASVVANTLEIVVQNGPLAGRYSAPSSDVICLHARTQHEVSAAYKNFAAHDARALSEVGISVWNPDDAGPKWGEVRVAFGDPDRRPTVYDVVVPRTATGPLTMSRAGRGGTLAFQGTTKDGVQLRVTAQCASVDEM
jgi:hypothetical protein